MQRAGPFSFALDAQAPLAPAPGDEVRSRSRVATSAPARCSDACHLLWDIPADTVREGVNAITLGITQTAVLPWAGRGDARELGLLVRDGRRPAPVAMKRARTGKLFRLVS